MSFEIDYSFRLLFRNNITKFKIQSGNWMASYEFEEKNLSSYLSQLFVTDLYEKMISNWQVRLRILDLRHLFGINETVYCVVQIGDKIFRTKDKNIEKLDFNEVFLLNSIFLGIIKVFLF